MTEKDILDAATIFAAFTLLMGGITGTLLIIGSNGHAGTVFLTIMLCFLSIIAVVVSQGLRP